MTKSCGRRVAACLYTAQSLQVGQGLGLIVSLKYIEYGVYAILYLLQGDYRV